MSHVAQIQTLITDLDALKAAVAEMGCTWMEGQTSYKWWGHRVGDDPLPIGFTVEELGQCQHAIRVPGAEFEIGVTPRRDGKPGYTLLYDFYGWQGEPIHAHLGEGLKRLAVSYTAQKTAKELRKLGAHVERRTLANGKTVVIGRMH